MYASGSRSVDFSSRSGASLTSIPVPFLEADPCIIMIGTPVDEDAKQRCECIKVLLRDYTFLDVPVLTSSWNEVEQMLGTNRPVALVFNKEAPKADLLRLYQLAMVQCAQQRRRFVHVVQNFKQGFEPLLASRRARRMLRHFDLTRYSIRELVEALSSSCDTDAHGFNSPGESFAWQLSLGFLSYILPNLEQNIRASLLDDRGIVKANVLRDYGVNDVQPSEILVLPVYFLLLSRQVASGQLKVDMTPSELFTNCRRIAKDRSSEVLQLEFDSPGYKKRIPAYLMKLTTPLANARRTSHVLFFAGYAAPQFIMPKLEHRGEIDKSQVFQDFVDELRFITGHPKFGKFLCDFSQSSASKTTGLEASRLRLVDADDQSAEQFILDEAEQYYSGQDWEIVENIGEESEDENGWQSVSAVWLKFSPGVAQSMREFIKKSLQLLHSFIVKTRQPVQCQRVLLVLDSTSLQDHSTLGCIQLAVENMHRCGEYNISVILVDPYLPQDVLSRLPPALSFLPDRCVVTVDGLGALNTIRFAFPFSAVRSGSFSELVDALELSKPSTPVEDTLPLMSMAYAMAANCWFGFGQLLREFGKELSFDRPYCFVIPRSGGYPDEAKLLRRFQEMRVRREELHFQPTGSGRRYSLRVFHWNSRRIAFEIPASVLAIRRQAECGIGGVRAGDVRAHLMEFENELRRLVESEKDNNFQVISWNDVSGFPTDAFLDPDIDYAQRLLDCCQSP